MAINITKIKEGMRVPSYREMCRLLEQPIKTGKSKQLQCMDWERYFSYHKEGNSYIIDEIYENPLPKIDLRGEGNYSKYVNEIADILVYWLSENTSNCNYNFSLGKLIGISFMANPSFEVGNKLREAVSIVLGLSREEVEIFFTDMRCEFKEIIERALNNLQNRCVILVKNAITVYDMERKAHRQATKDEEESILNWERQALNELGLRNKQEMFLQRKLHQFNRNMKPYLATINCEYHYYSYELTIGKNAVAKEKEFIDAQRKVLNNKCVERAVRKFNDGDVASMLVSNFIDGNSNYSSLIPMIKNQRRIIEEAKKQELANANSIEDLINITDAEEKEKEKQYQYEVNSYARKSLYNKLTEDEQIQRESGLL